ncbi:MAG TPA: peptidoglycan DD-metalloendopeptidase family protein [Myxococcota bacterium]|nr:peptidoglycan DD-metalloendopeptidase family protein [Myxococcota bacterium]
MYVTQGMAPKLSKRTRNVARRFLIGALAGFSLILIILGSNLVKSDRLISLLPQPTADIIREDLFETPISLLDNFFATRVNLFDEIRPGENLRSALTRMRVPQALADRFSQAIGKAINLRLLLPGDGLMIESSSPKIQLFGVNNLATLATALEPRAIELFAKDEFGVAYRIRAEVIDHPINGGIEVQVDKPTVYREHALLNGAVANSIYGTIIDNGGDAQLVNNFAEIFAWQFDFYKDTRDGDRYQMIVERNVSEGRFVNYGRVLAAEYVNNGKPLRGFYFSSKDGQIAGFFDDKGLSLKNAFLKAPLKIASITSRFGMRYHPIFGTRKPHNGDDYGAAPGTPFLAVASGSVTDAGYTPFNGNWVRIRHLNGYETEYLHATRLAKGVRVGAHVKQGQVIGYVGRTGLATGYHLHFGMKKNGKYVNPSSQKFARSAGVPPRYMGEFKRSIEAMVIALNRQGTEKQQVLASK